jgi:hypothetical protein
LHVQNDEAHGAVVPLRRAEDVAGEAGDGATEKKTLETHQVDGTAVAAKEGLGGRRRGMCGE